MKNKKAPPSGGVAACHVTELQSESNTPTRWLYAKNGNDITVAASIFSDGGGAKIRLFFPIMGGDPA